MLINGILKDELGFQGFVMTDWLAQQGGVSSALAGLDMAMPGDGAIPLLGTAFWGSELSTAILNGTVPLDRLNDMVGYLPSCCWNHAKPSQGHSDRSNLVSNGSR